MAAEGLNEVLDPSSLIQFIPPDWYPNDWYSHRHRRKPGISCFMHHICENVEENLLRLKEKEAMLPNPKPSDEDEDEMKDADHELFHSSHKKKAEVEMEDLDYQNKKMKILEEEEEEKKSRKLTPQQAVEWRQMMNLAIIKQNTTWLIKKGDNHDVEQLLSTPTRDFLIKSDEQQVEIKELRGKHVVLYFVWLCLSQGFIESLYYEDMEETYFSLREQFEIVLVALGDNHEEIFHTVFSKMPWLAIPYGDKQARQDLQERFVIPENSSARAVMFAPNGTVLATGSSLFRAYGPEGFPFTQDKLDEVEHDDKQLLKKLYWKQLSLTELFGESVTTFEGKQVSTSELEGKTVGLYFYDESYSGIERTRKLERIWASLEGRPGIDFEIVVNHSLNLKQSSAKAEFKKLFGNNPWYTLIGSGRKLRRVLRVDGLFRDEVPLEAGYLIILEPDRSLNYFAFDIIDVVGLDAYPFSLEKAVKLMKSNLEKTLMLDNLLSANAPLRRGCNTCSGYSSCRRCSTCSGEEDIVVSDIIGKRVLLLFATHSSYGSGKFLRELKKMYSEQLGTEKHFEIIYISLDCDKSLSSFPECIHEMPWLVHSFVPHFAASVVQQLFKFEYRIPFPAIAAFGPTGRLVAKEFNLAFKEKWSSDYPFVESYVCEQEVRKEFMSNYKWDLERIFPYISSPPN